MTIENITSGALSTIADLDSTLPASGDEKREGDDHIRNIKKALQLTLPNLSATCSGVASELAFAHKGGTVSGNAVIKGSLTCTTLTVSSTALATIRLVTESLGVGGSITVSGTAVMAGPTTMEQTTSISHLVALNILAGQWQSSATKVTSQPSTLTASYVSSGQYKITHSLGTSNYVVQALPHVPISPSGAGTSPHAFIESADANSVLITVRPTSNSGDFLDSGLHITIIKP